MRIITLKGQPCRIEEYSKKIYITIHKPTKKNTFSLSDSFVGYLKRGYTGIIRLPYRDIEITKNTPTIGKPDKIKSIYPNGKDWHRYWYAIPKNEEGQLELFNKSIVK